MKLLFGTGNNYKYELMKKRLEEFKNIEIITPKMIGLNINIVEDGRTAEENAIKKAKQYYEATKMNIISEDSGLYIDKFNDNEQPGLFVKRINGVEGLSNEEILNYYIDKLNKYGGESLAHYYSGVCIINENGIVHSDTIDETEFLLTTKGSNRDIADGGVLECISYDINANKYFYERNDKDLKNHYRKLDEKYRNLVKKFLLDSNFKSEK